MLFIDNEDSVFRILFSVCCFWLLLLFCLFLLLLLLFFGGGARGGGAGKWEEERREALRLSNVMYDIVGVLLAFPICS